MAFTFDPLAGLPAPQAGSSVSFGPPAGYIGIAAAELQGAGDINGDGFDDIGFVLLQAAPGNQIAPAIAVRLGGPQALGGPSGALPAAGGGRGFDIVGASPNDRLTLFAIADINGDGIADLLLGAQEAGTGTAALGDGRAYAIFGGAGLNGLTQVSLGALNGSNGMVLAGPGAAAHQAAGVSASFGASVTAADLDGDGIADMIVGAPWGGPLVPAGGEAGPARLDSTGQVHVVFGRGGAGAEGIGGTGLLRLDAPGATAVTTLTGAAMSEFGRSVGVPGDVNGDGHPDLVIGGDSYRAEVTVVLGGPGLRGAGTVDATAIAGAGTSAAGALRGFRIRDSSPDAEILSLPVPGLDFDGDGLADIALGRVLADGTASIEIIHGSALLGGADIDLAAPPGPGRTTIANAFAGSFAQAVDINGDGIDDLVFGNPLLRDAAGNATGGVVVVFGRAQRGAIDAAALDGTDGFVVMGVPQGLYAGIAVNTSDLDGDGRPEIGVWSGAMRLFEPQPTGGSLNRPPVAQDDLLLVPGRGPQVANLLADNGSGPDSDPDGDPLRVVQATDGAGQAVAIPAGGFASLRFDGPRPGSAVFVDVASDGTATLRPEGSFAGLTAGTQVVIVMPYVLSDGQATDSATATFVHLATNAAPVARNDLLLVPGRGPQTVDLMADNGAGPDFDPDGDPLRIAAVRDGLSGALVPVPQGGAVTVRLAGPRPDDVVEVAVRDNGVATLLPGNSFRGLVPGIEHRMAMAYVLSDGQATGGATATFVHVASNMPPVARDDLVTLPRLGIGTANLFADNGAGPDFDPDGDPIRLFRVVPFGLPAQEVAPGAPAVYAVPGPLGSQVSVSVTAAGAVTVDAGDLFQRLPEGQQFRHELLYQITDGVATAQGRTVLQFTSANRPPQPQDDHVVIAARAGGVVNLFAANGGLPDSDPDGDPLRIVAVSGPLGNLAPMPASGQIGFNLTAAMGLPLPVPVPITFAADGRLILTALPDGLRISGASVTVPVALSYVVADPAGVQATARIHLTLTDSDLPPVANDDMIALGADEVLVFDLRADTGAGPDFDPEGGALTYALLSPSGVPMPSAMALALPGGARIEQTATPGVFELHRGASAALLPAGFEARFSFGYMVRDPGGQSDTAVAHLSWLGLPTVPLQGTPGNDYLYGTPLANLIQGLAGNDTIEGQAGDDTLAGGPGDDLLDGGEGNDLIYGGPGNDTLRGHSGQNRMFGDDGHDQIMGGDDGDFIGGGPGNDTIRGGAGNDTIYGGEGNDDLAGGAGDDLIYGGAGSNWIWAGAGNDTVHGAEGNDSIFGGAGSNRLFGHDGNDDIRGGPGDDYIAGGAGNDSLFGDSGNDTIFGGAGDDLINGHDGDDILIGGAGTNRMWGAAGNDTLHSGLGRDIMNGGPGADVFVFASAAHIGIGASRDVIEDFAPGQDRIDLSALGTAFNGTAGLIGGGQASFYHFAAGGLLIGDHNGDGLPDWVIELHGVGAVTAAYFIL